jgi:hypothetical protein
MSVDEALAIWLVLTIVVGYLLLAGLWCLLLPCQSRVRSTRTIYARHALEERGERASHFLARGQTRYLRNPQYPVSKALTLLSHFWRADIRCRPLVPAGRFQGI